MNVLTNPLFGIFLSLVLYLLGQELFKRSKGFFLFQPLFFAMVSGILVLIVLAKALGTDTATVYTKAYKPGGDMIFWFLNPATIAFAIPLYKKNDVVKKYWKEILLSLLMGMFISLGAITAVSKFIGLSATGLRSMLSQAATTAIALPITSAVKGNPAITAMACILNAVIIYALGKYLVKIFRLNDSEIGAGLGLGTAGHTIGSAFALELGETQGAIAAVAVVVIGVVVDVVVPIFATIL